MVVVLFEATAPQVEKKKKYNFKYVLAYPSIYRSQTIQILMVKPLSAGWQTLYLHAEYRVYTSHAAVYTELVWLYFLPSAFFLST